MRILFVTWDGPGTTYHESLFLPLLARATQAGDEVHLLAFSWDADERSARIAATARQLGMTYESRSWRRQPTALEVPGIVAKGALKIASAIRRRGIDVILSRSIIPGAMAVAAGPTRTNVPFVYDADGLPADERVEFAGWHPSGLRYRIFSAIERASVRRAEVVLVRTSQAAEILQRRAGVPSDRFHVVTNGKDEQVYTPGTPTGRDDTRSALGIPLDVPLVVYVGSVGPKYQPDVMASVFEAITSRRTDAVCLVLTARSNHETVIRSCSASVRERLILHEAPPTDVPRLLAAADLGLALINATPSMRAVAPIKVAEYLLCGVPIAYSTGVGDLDRQLGPEVGYRVTAASTDYRELADWLIDDVMPNREQYRLSCRARGIDHHSLSRGALDYREALVRARRPS